jgi:hypothetical protein
MTRRDLLKTGLTATSLSAMSAAEAQSVANTPAPPPRERLLLDSGWRFHFGHASDPDKDFGFGNGGSTFAKQGRLAPPAAANFNDSAWQPVDLPHDWAAELRSDLAVRRRMQARSSGESDTIISGASRRQTVSGSKLTKMLFIGESKCGRRISGSQR